MNRNQAELKLNEVFGFERFHDNQWQTIDLLLKGKRVLLIEKTGFGKSLCYQFPAVNFDGITVVFSPLIALMRDQRPRPESRVVKVILFILPTVAVRGVLNSSPKVIASSEKCEECGVWHGQYCWWEDLRHCLGARATT